MELPPAQPQAAPVPQPAPAALQGEPRRLQDPQRYVSFNQLYSDETRDPCNRDYTRIMARFDSSLPDAVPDETLYANVVQAGSVPLHAYLCCGTGVGQAGPKIYCVHSPSRFPASLDGRITTWDNLSFAFLGELVHKQVTNVLFHENSFETIEVQAYTVEHILAHLEELNHITPIYPPVLPDDAGTMNVRTRRCMYLPAAYVPLLLRSGGYTVKQVWEVLYPAIALRQELVICQPLLRWLQAASMGTTVLNLQVLGDPAVALPLCAPPADDVLLGHRLSILHLQLPGLTAPPQSIETALSQMATALITQTNDNKLVRDQKAAEELEPKLPSRRFTVTLPVLLELLQTPDERNLPDIWHKWANCTKKQDFQVLRDGLEAFARSPQAFSPTVPIVSAKLVQEILNFNFLGESADDIKTGFHPFIIAEGNAEHRQSNREVARLYGFLQQGDTSISLADLESLQSKELRSVPLTYWELEKSLGAFGNLVAVVLGPAHPLCLSYKEMWTLINSGLRDDLHAVLEHKFSIKPVHILRSIQLQFYSWFNHRRHRLPAPLIDLKSIITQIIMGLYVIPHLPPSLYQLANPKRPQASDSVPGLVSAGSASQSSGSSVGDASTVSGLTTPTHSGTPPTPPGRGAFITNLTPHESITSLDRPQTKIKDIMGTAPPPKMADGTEMCLSFHLRGGCWSNCRRAANHAVTLSANDLQRLRQYLTRRFAALTPPPTVSGTSQGSQPTHG